MLPKINFCHGIPSFESPSYFQWINTIPKWVRPIAQDLHTKGYAVLDFPDPKFEDWAYEIKTDLEPHFDLEAWRKKKLSGQVGGLRIQDAAKFSPAVKELAVAPKILKLLELIYGRMPFPFQTLNFPVGTEQNIHSDTVHFSSWPERFLCGVWVALEDIGEKQGPLFYWPGSHRFPCLTNEFVRGLKQLDKPSQKIFEPVWLEMVKEACIQPEKFVARKGQVLIWTANLLHAGGAHTDLDCTRWSQVTHYYFEGCSYWTPMLSDVISGRIEFRNPNNYITGKIIPSYFSGQKVPVEIDKDLQLKLMKFQRAKLRISRWFSEQLANSVEDK